MPRWQGKSKGTPLGYRIFVYVIKTFGLAPAYLLLRFVAFYYFLFSWDSSKHAIDYFRHLDSATISPSLVNLYRNYFVFGQTLLDRVVVRAGIRNKFTFNFDGEHHLQAIVQGGKGGILLSAHVGSWEIAGHLLKRLNTSINIVMYDAEHEKIKSYLEQVTGKQNVKIILIKDDMSHVFAMGEALQKNELICLHADRFLEGNKTVEQSFLGESALFPAGPFLLAASFRVPVCIVFAFKEPRMHYHLYGCAPIAREAAESKDVFMDRLLKIFVNQLEEKVKMYPLQWFNYFNFWSK